MFRSIIRLALLGATALGAGSAQARDEQVVASARSLANEGITKIVAGDCAGGQPLVERAEALHHAIVHQRYIAQCLADSGKLVAATELWRRMLREGAPADASDAVHEAVAEAESRLAQTLPRLASTTVSSQSEYPQLTLELDGVNMPSALLGAPQVLDPGSHRIHAGARGFEDKTLRWTLREGEHSQLVVDLVQAPVPQTSPSPASPEADSSVLTPVGIVLGSLGVGALVAGTTAWIVKEDKEQNLAMYCPQGRCDGLSSATLDSEKQTIMDLTTATLLLNISGGVLLATGVGLVLWDQLGTDAQTAESAGVRAVVHSARLQFGATPGGTAVSVSGRF